MNTDSEHERKSQNMIPGLNQYGKKDGNPILMIHGWGADHRYFELAAEQLQDYRILVPDITELDYCENNAYDRYSISGISNKLCQIADGLGINELVVMGHSMGGMIAQEFAINNPGIVKALILEDTTPGMKHFIFTRFVNIVSPLLCLTPRWLRKHLYLRWAVSKENRSEIAGSIQEEYARTSCPKILLKYVRKFKKWSSVERLDKIHAPTLVIRGEQDRLFTKKHSDVLGKIVISKNVVIPKSAHTPHLENPDVFCSEVRMFLKNLDW